MKIGGIGGIPVGMMTPEQNIPETGDQIQSADDLFGPGYEVSISEEGRKLLEGQTGEEAQKDAGSQGIQLDEGRECCCASWRKISRPERPETDIMMNWKNLKNR